MISIKCVLFFIGFVIELVTASDVDKYIDPVVAIVKGFIGLVVILFFIIIIYKCIKREEEFRNADQFTTHVITIPQPSYINTGYATAQESNSANESPYWCSPIVVNPATPFNQPLNQQPPPYEIAPQIQFNQNLQQFGQNVKRY